MIHEKVYKLPDGESGRRREVQMELADRVESGAVVVVPRRPAVVLLV